VVGAAVGAGADVDDAGVFVALAAGADDGAVVGEAGGWLEHATSNAAAEIPSPVTTPERRKPRRLNRLDEGRV